MEVYSDVRGKARWGDDLTERGVRNCILSKMSAMNGKAARVGLGGKCEEE